MYVEDIKGRGQIQDVMENYQRVISKRVIFNVAL
jgi:hypothetical protein